MKFIMTLPVLERLLGGDTAVEVELRKSIANEFAKRHLVALAKELKVEVINMKQVVYAELLRDLGATRLDKWDSTRVSLSDGTLELVRAHVNATIREEVAAATKRAWAEMKPEALEAIRTCYEREMLQAIRVQVREDIVNSLKNEKA